MKHLLNIFFTEFANRKCELNGHWGGRPNEPINPNGWTDYNPCFKPEVKTLLEKVPNLEVIIQSFISNFVFFFCSN